MVPKLCAVFALFILLPLSIFCQGITLLYRGIDTLGFGDSLNWVQIDPPSGQTPIYKVPTYLDDVVFSKSRSNKSAVYVRFSYDDTLSIGGGEGSFCHKMFVYGTLLDFTQPLGETGAPISVHTKNGGALIMDSAAVLNAGMVYVYGEDPNVTGLVVRNSQFGANAAHNLDLVNAYLMTDGRASFFRSSILGFYIGNSPDYTDAGGYKKGGGIVADSCTFNIGSFIMGDNSADTITNCFFIPNGINDGGLKFFVGKNSRFVSANDSIMVHYGTLEMTTSGSVFNGNIRGWYLRFKQEDVNNSLPNIINGNVHITEDEAAGLSGSVKISGNLSNGYPADGCPYCIAPVYVDGKLGMTIGNDLNFGNKITLSNCSDAEYCHHKIEFYGENDSYIDWKLGFPVDTFVVNKSNCAKVTCPNGLYVVGETRIAKGQLKLTPNPLYPYSYIAVGNTIIEKGGGIFLAKDSLGHKARVAMAGILEDKNTTSDSLCTGFSNPYSGVVIKNASISDAGDVNLIANISDEKVILYWTRSYSSVPKYFLIEKGLDNLIFKPLAKIDGAGRHSSPLYQFLDTTGIKRKTFYRLKVFNLNGSLGTSNVISISPSEETEVAIYPNPVADRLTIKIPAGFGKSSVRVFNINGALIARKESFGENNLLSIDLPNLPGGLYAVEIISADVRKVLKFVKD